MNQTAVFALGWVMCFLTLVFARLTVGLLTGNRASRREYAMGFGTTTVLGKTSCRVFVKAQVRFAPERLMVSPRCSDMFIREVGVGDDGFPIFRPGEDAPADVLGPGGSFPLGGKIAEVGDYVTIVVYNQSSQPREFQAVVAGPCGRL